MFRDFLVKGVDATGLGPTLRTAKHAIKERMVAHGYLAGEPLVPEESFQRCIDESLAALERNGGKTEGEYLEFGVSRGTSLSIVHSVLRSRGAETVRLIGFDSFEGMPEAAAGEGWKPGQYRSPIEATSRFLMQRGVDPRKLVLVKGWFDDTLTDETRSKHRLGKAFLTMIDCDIYSASRTALWFAEQHIADVSILVFDDWGWAESQNIRGQREVFQEFLAEFPHFKATRLPSYRPEARVFLLKRSDPAQGRA
jgi:O-methyltransferase